MKVALESTSHAGMPSVKTGMIIVVGTFCFPTAIGILAELSQVAWQHVR